MLHISSLAAAVAASILVSLSAHAADAPTFKSFPTQDSIHLAEPDLKKGSVFWDFRTRIRNGAKREGVTYNGVDTVVTWGCGLPCKQGVVINRKKSDNNIIALPLSTLGYEVSFDSSMLVVNPYLEEYDNTGEIPEFLYREFYNLVDEKFVFVCADKGEGTRCIDEKEYNAAVTANN